MSALAPAAWSPLASAASSGGGGGGGMGSLLLLLPLLLLAYLFFAQRKRQKKLQEVQAALEIGQRVMTTTGLFGTVAALDEASVHIEAAPGVVLQWDRRAVVPAQGAQPPSAQPGDQPGGEA